MGLKTTEDLAIMLQHWQDFYRQRNMNFMYWQDLYTRRPEVIWQDEQGLFIEPEPDEVRYVPPIAYNTVEAFRELMLTKAPTISVPQMASRGETLIHAEHNEKALLAIWDRAEIYERLRDSLWYALTYGWGVLQILWDPEAKDYESPVMVLSHDPYNVYAAPGVRPNSWKYVIHAYPRVVSQVKEDWYPGEEADGRFAAVRRRRQAFDDLKESDEVTFIDYWDEEVNAVAIQFTKYDVKTRQTSLETRWIKEPTAHNYGFLPWQIYMPCRLPFQTKGEKMGVSLLYAVQETIVEKARFLSQKATMVRRWQDPPLVTQTEAGPDFEPTRAESGLHLRLGIDEKAGYLTHPGPMPQMDTVMQELDSYIEASALPRVLQGEYVGAVSGIAMSLLRNPTLMKIGFKQKEIERAAERMNHGILQLLEKKLNSPLSLWGEEAEEEFDTLIDPDQIEGYYRNRVRLSASLPTDDASTVNMLATMVQLNILSRATARDVAQQTLHDLVPQSLIDEEERIMAELILHDEGLVMALAQAAAQKVNLPYLPSPENPMGGRGAREVRPPAGTLPSQIPGMPGGNAEPSMDQRIEEMMKKQVGPTGAAARAMEPIE